MKKMYLLIALLAVFAGQSLAQRQSPYTRLIWSDEFDGTGIPDPAKWSYEVGYVRNGEMQYYTNARVENAYQEGGHLHIKAMKDDPVYDDKGNLLNTKNDRITSASIITKGKASWVYGRIEVRAKVPGPNKGSWPAIWMMPVANNWGNWPNSGEIDIMEHVGYSPEQTHFTSHTFHYHDSGAGGLRSTASDTPHIYDDFHVFALEWDEEGLYWYLDDHKLPVHEFYNESRGNQEDWKVWPFQKNFYLILGLAYGGGWGGRLGVDYQLPMEFLVDYVRVYKLPEAGIETADEVEIKLYPNPVTDVLNISGAEHLAEVSLFDISGKLAARYGDVKQAIDLSGLDKGFYTVRLTDKNNRSRTQKILKQ
ncbi:MAG: family 16 glycosylhydrolase [Dysgonamonadaceae bacterium]|jgi:beta-glucanase (GH16 family)|nr:family 16 glycosylhydrolase [Dysgonamonadaceae bacterium]